MTRVDDRVATRIRIGVKLTSTDQTRTESAQVLAAQNIWTSAPGGWLSQQNGVWNQLPDGLHLMDSSSAITIALLQGCNFFTSQQGETGRSTYPNIGEAGGWEVLGTVP